MSVWNKFPTFGNCLCQQQSMMMEAETASKMIEIHSIFPSLIAQDVIPFSCHESFKSCKTDPVTFTHYAFLIAYETGLKMMSLKRQKEDLRLN
jgi:hypothetical protein